MQQPPGEMELVRMCNDEFEDLEAAFTLPNDKSMLVSDLRSYTEASLKKHVMKLGGPDGLVPLWLDDSHLRSAFGIRWQGFVGRSGCAVVWCCCP